MSRITIKEIARMANVSPTAVSFVINNHDGVSDETRQKILDVIKATGFKPSTSSRRLLMKKSFNIALLLNPAASPFIDLFYNEIAKGILEKSREYDYNIVISEIRDNRRNRRLPDLIYSGDADGIIFFSDIEPDILKEVLKTEIPFVVADSHAVLKECTSLNPDYEMAAATATKYLTVNGHRRIALITSSFVSNFFRQTSSGFLSALEQAGIAAGPIYQNARDEESAYNCMAELLGSGFSPTAVLCAVDMFAISAMRCIRDHGLGVPENISVIGIDDIFLSSYKEFNLTTVKIDKTTMGRMAFDMIMDKVSGEKVESVLLPANEIAVRGSVMPVNGSD